MNFGINVFTCSEQSETRAWCGQGNTFCTLARSTVTALCKVCEGGDDQARRTAVTQVKLKVHSYFALHEVSPSRDVLHLRCKLHAQR